MKKIFKIIGIVLLIILFIFLLFKIITYKEKSFSHIKIDDKYKIVNATKTNYLDTIVYAGLKSIDIDSVNVAIISIDRVKKCIDKENDDIQIKAFVVGHDNIYQIYIGDYSKRVSISIISHEIVHIKQYYNKKLIDIGNNTFIWERDTTNVMNYNDRPWEKEAFKEQKDIENKMIDILYQ